MLLKIIILNFNIIQKIVSKIFIVILILLAVFAIPVGLTTGIANISYDSVFTLFNNNSNPTAHLVFYQIRLPRMLLAFMVGASLGISGAVFQGLLINPLADSYTTGIASGSAFGASVAILLGLGGYFLPLFAIIGAIITLLAVMILSAKSGGFEPRNLILSGIVVGAILSAGLSLIKSISGDSLGALIFWLLGSFSGRSWTEVLILSPYFILGTALILLHIKELDLLAFGSEQASALGVNVKRTRYILIISSALLSATSVAVSGIIGFVGLVAPHIIRSVFGATHKVVLPLSFFFGGLILLWADILVRALSFAGEIPVGVITSLIGGPFFCILLMRKLR